MRDEYPSSVLAPSGKSTSELDVRAAFNREHPPLTGLAVQHDLRTMELPERPWRNNRGQWFDLSGYEILNAHLAELKPGTPSVRHRHTTEAYLYVVKGRGFSIINFEGEPEQIVEWSEGTLFAPPRWAWHQHFNLLEDDTSRYLAIQDTGLLKTMRLHQIERHPVQLSAEEAAQLFAEARGARAAER